MNETKLQFQLYPDEPTTQMIYKIKSDLNINSNTDAARLLIKKGYTEYIKEQSILNDN